MTVRTITLHCALPEPAGTVAHRAQGLPAPGSVHLWFAPLRDLEAFHDRYLGMLDAEEHERAARFRQEADRMRYILGHGFLRETLAHCLQAQPEALRFSRGPFGKPAVDGSGIRFNFSDTKDAVLIGASSDEEIGVDLETAHRRVEHDAVAQHYFTPEEVEELEALAQTAAKERFLELWTRKEAVLKASGVGIMDDLRAMRVSTGRHCMRVQHPAFAAHAAAEYHIGTWRIGDAHIASLASARPLTPIWVRLGA
ncbi:MAG: 4'-phosphopantetheinyl transferase superfamily protein [Flavobacteriales bacterium]|nr:MAG: 4'-phosphopantetheinyl transferase superfamily protein [Flavobacteriales bacterium]